MESLEYKGNKYFVEKIDSWRRKDEYRISVEEINSGEVCLPESYAGGKITEWFDRKSENNSYHNKESRIYSHFNKAKRLYIPAAIDKINIPNDIFPELDRVEIDSSNQEFCTDGRLIVRRKGMELLHCLVCKGESVEIPEYVRSICKDSFKGTQYTEISFPKNEPKIHKDAFDGSKWLALQGDVVVIGATLFKIPRVMQRLVVPEYVKKYHPDVFDDYRCPQEMVTPLMPRKSDIESMNSRFGIRCRFLKLTSEKASVNMANLRRWESLQGVEIVEGHVKYKTLDGVVYSRDGRTLVWYPCQKPGEVFAVPEGVQKIGEFAFANQRRLKRIILPQSVRILGTGAFSNCQELEQVEFSARIKAIPDASAYRGAGMFSECPKLKSVVLPTKMTYLGSFAFYESGLRSIELGESLEQIGEYALMAPNLVEVNLPSSVKRLGKGSLFYVRNVTAYEGTAKGIVAAVNSYWPQEKMNNMNLKWSGCQIEVLHKKGGKKDCFLIPESLKRGAAYHLEYAWNGECIDYEEYDECLDEIADPDEKLEFAQYGLLRMRAGEDNIYEDYIRRVSFKLGCRLLEEGGEKEFLSLLKRDFISDNSLQKLLKYSNELGETVCSAYITDFLRKKNGKRKDGIGFRL